MLLKLSGILWIFDRKMLSGKHQLVLCYHRISEQKLRLHISYLKKHFNIIPLKSMLNAVFDNNDSHEHSSNKPLLALTMDDCFTTDFLNANKVCQENKINCTYFIPIFYMQNNKSLWSYRLNYFLSNIKTPNTIIDFENNKVVLSNDYEIKKFEVNWIQKFLYDNIQTLDIDFVIDQFISINSFIENVDVVIDETVIRNNCHNKYASFQSHTVTHPKLFMCSEQELEIEFETSKNILSNLSENEVQYVICYPYGSSTHIGNSYTKASKYYEYGVTLQSGVLNKQTDKMLIPRIGIYEHDTYQSIRMKIFFAQLRAII